MNPGSSPTAPPPSSPPSSASCPLPPDLVIAGLPVEEQVQGSTIIFSYDPATRLVTAYSPGAGAVVDTGTPDDVCGQAVLNVLGQFVVVEVLGL